MRKKLKEFNWLRFIVRVLPVIAAVIVFLTTRLAAKHPEFVEAHYSTVIYPVIARLLSSVSGIFPFSLWDIFWALVLIFLLSVIILALFRKITPGRVFIRLIQAVSVMYIWFYISWGYNYFRPDISTRLAWEPAQADEAEFRSGLDTIIFGANYSYVKIDSSVYSEMDSLIEDSFSEKSDLFGITYPNGKRRVKTMVFSRFMAKSGMNGYFGPFFNEVHINARLLPMDYPFALAHEKAHQFGIGSEAEANLISYSVCTGSDDQRLRYSAYLMILLYFLDDASGFKDYGSYLEKIDKRVIKDLIYRRDYYRSLQNKTLDKVHSAANDAYLKANSIKAGVDDYNQVVALIISYNKQVLKNNM